MDTGTTEPATVYRWPNVRVLVPWYTQHTTAAGTTPDATPTVIPPHLQTNNAEEALADQEGGRARAFYRSQNRAQP